MAISTVLKYYLVGAVMVIFGILLIQELIFETYTDHIGPFIKWYPVTALTLIVLGAGLYYKGYIESKK
jgi:hypothetical protein